MPKPTPKTIRLKDYLPTPYLIDTVDLTFRLKPQATRVVSKMQMRPNPKSKTHGALRLDGEQLKLISITLDGNILAAGDYTCENANLTIKRVPQKRFTLEIETECAPASNTALSGLYMSNGIYCTQCEAEGFRRITYFYDRPDVLATYRVRIEAEKSLSILLSNGNPQARGPIAGTDFHFAEWHDPHPKPSYLFALVAGNLAKVESRFTTMEGRDVALGIYVEQGKQDRCAWAMQSLKAAMQWDEEAFSRAYDLDVFNIVAVSDFNMGAMENKGLNVFNDKYILARPDTATDIDFELIEAVIAHEYFHNWTGNRITCRDWFQLCLKEGLTVFRDQEFTSDLRSRAVKRIDDVQDLRNRQMPEDAGPLQHPPRPSEYIEINNFYTATVYEKGAEICRMLKTLIGEKAFARGMQLYFRRHDGQAATVEQFIACFTQTSRKNLTQFFRWYEQAGTPLISLKEKYNAKHRVYKITISQKVKRRKGQQPKKALHMPLHIGLLQQNGKEISKTLELKRASQVFTIKNVATKPVLSFNRKFSSAIVNTHQPKLADQLFLLAHDSDSFNRWEQAQSVAQQLIIEHYRHGASAKWQSALEAFTKALREPLLDETLEPAYRAKLLELPELASLAESLGKDVDATKLENARNMLRVAIGASLATQFETLYQSLAVGGPYSPDPDSNGRRALRSAILSLAADAKASWVYAALRQQFAARDNMTEEYAALRVAANMGGALGDEFITAFYERHQHDALLIDKWFTAQALIPGVGSAERLRQLMGQHTFNFKTPNRVYALLRNFIGNNFSGFHVATGAGYLLAAQAIIHLNAINPQVASRLATGFRSWQLFDAPRRKKAHAAMQEILRVKDLSRDVYEIISRTLKT